MAIFIKKNDPLVLKMRFVHDLSIAVKVNLDKDIVTDLTMEKSLTFDQRNETRIADSSNTPQLIADSLEIISRQRQMKMNTNRVIQKSCVKKICKSLTVTFPIEIDIEDNQLEVK